MLIVTTSHSILCVDENKGIYHRLETGYGLYYGIARKEGCYYVAARRRLVSSNEPREFESGEIRVFDESFNFLDAWRAPFLLRDIHQISFVDDDLFVTCSYDNLVAVRRANGSWEKWFPLSLPLTEPFDVNHFNSISVFGNHIALVAHNHSLPSEIYFFDKNNFSFLRRVVLGVQAHNCWVEDDDLFTCSSGEGVICSSSGVRIDIGNFTRGFASGCKKRFVGISKSCERVERDFTTGMLVVFDDKWSRIGGIILEREGLVLDLLYINHEEF
jgi:hypothetical protein